mmetsp:Transcript_1368/g.1267  ORF Transcript_1368/g.1267 Transcript_1368/m.1267 type:complete len:194 (-) Transcript_1368:112-693(-)
MLLKLAFMPLVAAEDNCETGLTLSGLSQTFDGDYVAHGFDVHGADFFSVNQGKPNELVLTRGCGLCDATERNLTQHAWAIWKMPLNSAKVQAYCTQGCPDAKYWPKDWNKMTKWMIKDQAVQVSSVHAYCCKRKAQTCDTCSEDECQSHSFIGCLGQHAFGCCDYSLATGCVCAKPPLECDGESESSIVKVFM